ncbi:MAG: hypothetical protein AAGF79_17530, partial [Pseudomonadota bacterium]
MNIRLSQIRFFVLSIGLLLFFPLGSIYVFQSGVPQPADLILVTCVLVGFLLGVRAPMKHSVVIYRSMAFLIWVVIISLVWVTITGELSLLRIMSYYIYNIMVFIFIVAMSGKDSDKFWKIIKYAALIGVVSLSFQFLIKFDFSLKSQTLGFNNPNQLGYFVLCLACILYAVRIQGVINRTLFLLTHSILSCLIILSFSAGATISILL